MRFNRLACCLALLVPLLAGSRALALDPSGVLVLYNNASPEGLAIANHYAQVHPGVQLLGLDNLGTGSTISASDYLTNIRTPVLSALTPSIGAIATTKGMPLHVNVQASNPGSYTDAWGVNRFVLNWETQSSLESELTKIDYVATEVMMGDQSFNIGNFTNNAYYFSSAPFSNGDFTGQNAMRLTARLDGFSVADVTGAIDRAQNAFVGPSDTPSGPFHFLVDHDPGQSFATSVTNLAENVLPDEGMPLTYDNSGAYQGTAKVTAGDFVVDAPVLGYVGHGANQSSTPDLVPGVGSYVATALDIALADGALFSTWESFNAESFDFGDNHGDQALLAEWLAKGGTAAVGNVAEPTANINSVINEDHLFDMMLEGMTLAEAAWSSARQLSWVNTVVGDPLMTWKMLLPGDANMDGVVDMGDLATIGSSGFGSRIDPNDLGWSQGDLNGDGFVDMADVALVASSWGDVSGWSTAPPPNLTEPSSPLAMALFASMHPNPEPSSIVLLTVGMASLAGFGWHRRRKARPARIAAAANRR